MDKNILCPICAKLMPITLIAITGMSHDNIGHYLNRRNLPIIKTQESLEITRACECGAILTYPVKYEDTYVDYGL